MKINGYKINYSEKDLDKKINAETIAVELISKSHAGYKSLKDNDKKALEHLVKASDHINDVSLEQDHHQNLAMKKALEKEASKSSHAKKSLQLFNFLNGVEGTNGIDKKPIEIFKGIKGFDGRNFYPTDLSTKEFHKILEKMLKLGKNKEVKNILSARTMVRRHKDELIAIDYTKYFEKDFSLAAKELEQASKLVSSKMFKDYLQKQAKALLKNDENLDKEADITWAKMQDTDLEFTLSRENYDDKMTPTVFSNKKLSALLEKNKIEATSKDMIGARVGIINKEGTNIILKFKECMKELSILMPHSKRYKQSIGKNDLKQTMVDVDIVSLKGDYAQARGGLTVAQNLPNNDKLSVKSGGGRRNVYHRQIRQTTDKEKLSKILNTLVQKPLHKLYNQEADHLFVIGHENGHSLGPDSSYQNSLGIYKHIVEELKADVISLAFMPEYVKTKVITPTTLKEIYASVIIGRLFLKAKPQQCLPHRVADLIIFNYLLKDKAICFDKAKKLDIDFDKIEKSLQNLLSETIETQLSKSPKTAKTFIDKYSAWSSISNYIAKTNQKLGIKPYKDIRRHF